tara:strand:+ start:743 stop:928 length:186 start_codon:yes stop_codon:yes gene_type:complete
MIPTIQYTKHTEIPFYLREYLESVSATNSVEDIPLEEINGFMQMMEEVERGKYWKESTEDV